MNVKEALYQLLAGSADLAAVVGTRIRPVSQFIPTHLMTAEEKADNLPQLIYRVSAYEDGEDLKCRTNRRYLAQLDFYGLDPDTLLDGQEVVYGLLDGHFGDGFEGIFQIDSQDVVEKEGFHSADVYRLVVEVS